MQQSTLYSLSTSTKELTKSSKIRHLGLRERNKLTAILSVAHCWKDLAAVIRDPDHTEEYLYTSQNIDILDLQPNPAAAFLENWSTTGRIQPNLQDLLEALKEAHLLRAVHFVQHELLKDETNQDEPTTEELKTIVPRESDPYSHFDSIVDQLQGIDISDLKLFPYDDLAKATRNFCNLKPEDGGCKIGEGSYGSVYRASLLGVEVAVKQLKEAIDRQFFTELSILVRLFC
ncbi:hypothetical protein JTE90_008851 [Oedothorax gibbosus]|uniref:Death domain-containing protein n=1 Tax=Oedothorax gibbosus TaxID=931172 RepID=A0AAV6U127_9ARAC|nr:hypothetical protein JTE90_008851 [Oedothorax gibbosus]